MNCTTKEKVSESLLTNQLTVFCRRIKEPLDNRLNGIHAKPVTSVDEGRPPLGFPDKVAKKMRFRIIQTFDTPFRDNATVVGLSTP